MEILKNKDNCPKCFCCITGHQEALQCKTWLLAALHLWNWHVTGDLPRNIVPDQVRHPIWLDLRQLFRVSSKPSVGKYANWQRSCQGYRGEVSNRSNSVLQWSAVFRRTRRRGRLVQWFARHNHCAMVDSVIKRSTRSTRYLLSGRRGI